MPTTMVGMGSRKCEAQVALLAATQPFRDAASSGTPPPSPKQPHAPCKSVAACGSTAPSVRINIRVCHDLPCPSPGVTQGIRVQYGSGPVADLTVQTVDVSLNSIEVTRCGYDIGILSPPCLRAEVINYAPSLLTVPTNW